MKRLVFNNPALKERRRRLRNRATIAEKILWKALQRSQLGVKFRRQYSVGNYILDFYCPERKLGVELDGGIHDYKTDMDEYRTRTVMELGIEIIRFKNEVVEKNMEEVLKKINTTLSSSPS